MLGLHFLEACTCACASAPESKARAVTAQEKTQKSIFFLDCGDEQLHWSEDWEREASVGRMKHLCAHTSVPITHCGYLFFNCLTSQTSLSSRQRRLNPQER